MDYINLQKSDLSVSRLCIGGDPMGGHAWGAVQESELEEAVKVGIDKGINFFDTAGIYGLGEAERILGKALGTRFITQHCEKPLSAGSYSVHS